MAASPHVVILGAGFGGLDAARALKGAPVRVTLIDRVRLKADTRTIVASGFSRTIPYNP